MVSNLVQEFPVRGGRARRAAAGAASANTVRAVDGLSLTARPGRVTAVLGANGAGKTTTLGAAQGLLRPTSGTVSLLGEDPWRAGPGLRARVGIMLQDGGLPQAVRPVQLLRHVAAMYRHPADMDALVQRLGIDGFDSTPVRRLSGGQKQRVALAAALAGNPEVLFLDEPSAGLDPQSRRVVFDLIQELRERGTCIVLTTHLMDDAQRLADDVYIIEAGRNVLQGTVEDLLHSQQDSVTLCLELTETGLGLEDFFGPGLAGGLGLREEHHGRYEITGTLGPAHLAALSRRWTEQGALPISMDLQPRSLEDLFLDVSGREIR